MGFKTKFRKILRAITILTEDYGLRRSIWSTESIDGNGRPIPWYTFPCIEYLEGLSLEGFKVLEFGSGNSSLYWAKKCKLVTSIEHNKEWFEKCKKIDNLNVILEESKDGYVSSAYNIQYDIAIIDGIHRFACTQAILKNNLESKSLIILDNSDRHPDCAKLLRESKYLLEVDFHGFGPINSYTWTTSIFFSRNFECQSREGRMPLLPKGGLPTN